MATPYPTGTCTLQDAPSFAWRANEEFSGRASMGTAAHGAFAEMPWPFAYAEMAGYVFLSLSFTLFSFLLLAFRFLFSASRTSIGFNGPEIIFPNLFW